MFPQSGSTRFSRSAKLHSQAGLLCRTQVNDPNKPTNPTNPINNPNTYNTNLADKHNVGAAITAARALLNRPIDTDRAEKIKVGMAKHKTEKGASTLTLLTQLLAQLITLLTLQRRSRR
jgi:hypothetical protein